MKVEKMPGDACSDVRYVVSFDEPVFIIGFRLQSMIESLVYVTLEPQPGLARLTKSQLRQLRAELDKYSQYEFFCQTDTLPGERFARFFGFEPSGYAWGRHQLTRRRK